MTIITIYYVTWLCQLSQIFVLSFANAFVFVGIYEYIDVDVIVLAYHADVMDQNLSLQWHF